MITLSGQSSDWRELWSSQINALPSSSGGTYIPIPETPVPVYATAPMVAISVSTANPRPKWRYAGLVTQKIVSGITTGGNPDAGTPEQTNVWLNKINLIRFQFTSPNGYGLYLLPPRWFQNVSYTVLEYVGNAAVDKDAQLYVIEAMLADLYSRS